MESISFCFAVLVLLVSVKYSENAKLLRDTITINESSSFFNHFIFPENVEIEICHVIVNGLVLNLDVHTPRVITRSEEIPKQITSLGQGLCGLRYTNATKDLTFVEWTLVATDSKGNVYNETFVTVVNSPMKSNHYSKTKVLLGQNYLLECPTVGTFCHIINPDGKTVQTRSCKHRILYVTMKEIGLWKCHAVVENSMESIENTIELVTIGSKATMGWTNETEYYVNVGCQTIYVVNYCRMIAPNGKILLVDAGFATDRYLALGTNLEEGICSVMISKPLRESERGLWKCQLTKGNFETGTLITIGESRTIEYQKIFKLSVELNKPLTINCEIPYSSDYCRIVSPSGSNFVPDKPEELSLGRCSLRKEHAGKYDEGNWTCLFARETGFPEERIVVSVFVNDPYSSHISEERVKEGGTARLMCKRWDAPLSYCRFVSPGDVSYHIRDEDNSSTRIRYFGTGLQDGECGIMISNATMEDSGEWTCVHQSVHGIYKEKQVTLVVAQTRNTETVKSNGSSNSSDESSSISPSFIPTVGIE